MSETTIIKEKLLAYLIIDDIQAKKELLNKATDDDGFSLSHIADIYYNKKDYTKARNWYFLSAAQNYSHAQFRLGRIYNFGEGVSVNYKLAMKWYLKAHKNGYIKATNNIRLLYVNGYGVLQDYKIAMEWYLDAANKGSSCALWNVGLYYERGIGVEIDKIYALVCYKKSAEQGYEDATRAIDRLNKEGFHINKNQMNDLQIEKNVAEMKSKIILLEEENLVLNKGKETLETQVESLEQELKTIRLNNSVYKNERVDENKVQEVKKRYFKKRCNWLSHKN